jgi:hypothetical protein
MPLSTSISKGFVFTGRMALGAIAVAVGLELMLHVLPVSSSTNTGYHFDPEIITYPPYHKITISTGWDLRNAGRYRTNNFGFLASRDFVPDAKAVAIIGDSYVEANMLPEADRLAGQLEARLGARPVYPFGGPGSSLLDYDERVRFIREKLGIRDFVIIIERGDVMETLCGSGNIHSPCMDAKDLSLRHERQTEPGSAKKILRHSALAQYFFSQLRIRPDALLVQLFPFTARGKESASSKPAGGPEDVPPSVAETIVHRFIEGLPRGDNERYILVFDSERDDIREGKPIHAPVRRQFMQMVKEAGLDVVDTEPLFRKHLQRSILNLEVGPYDRHCNTLANKIVADAVSQRIQGADATPKNR